MTTEIIPSTEIMAHASEAPLPKMYENACTALADCTRIDECADWANKAQALASYARQSNDDTLQKSAMRIQARAIRRCGELLKEIDRPEQGGRPKENGGGTPPVSRRSVASEAGLSIDQQKTAVRVANVPERSFNLQVESETPPTVTALAEQGKKSSPKPLVDPKGRSPKDFATATQMQGDIRNFATICQFADWNQVIRGSFPKELGAMKGQVLSILLALETLRSKL